MRRSLASLAIAAVGLSVLVVSPSTQAADPRKSALSSIGSSDYESDEDYFLYYVADGTESNCGGDTSCDIEGASFAISRDLPDDLLAVVSMAGPTDPELSNNDNGGIYIYIDSDGDPGDWDYLAITRYQSYDLDEFVSSTLQEWDGEEWQWTDYEVQIIRSRDYWGIVVPWREIGIETASFAVKASNAAGESDWAPESRETAYLPLAEAVDGPAGLTEPEITDVSYKKKGKKATAAVTWGAIAGATSYEVRWSLNGKGWTNWRMVKATRVTIKGLVKNKPTRIEIRAKDSAGAGPESSDTLGWGPAFGM